LFGLVLGELNLIGTSAYCGEHAQVIELLQQGKVPAELFITGPDRGGRHRLRRLHRADRE